MSRLAMITLLLLAGCANQPPSLSVGSAPIGTNASTGQPSLTPSATGPGGINQNYYTGSDPNFPGGGRFGGRGMR